MKTFYHFAMQFRGIESKSDERKQLAEWMFRDHDFPKQSTNYDDITRYLEMNSPFPGALKAFDALWDEFLES
ncbi:YozE family protein [Alkalibacillus silvisoli]|uniref:YozE family protein n=1 Tax=Alkalibacillus silvisoli TaxID=392823 RepID=A0ABP3JNS5_9BACI